MGLRGPKSAAKKHATRAIRAPMDVIPWEKPGLSRYQKVVAFIQCLPITSGTEAGKPFRLRPWQKKILRAIYRVRRGRRVVRTALLTIPRKNGKTQLAAALALCHLLGPEAEERGQVYSAAADREQASIIFRELEAVILRIPEFEERCHIQSFHRTITDTRTGSVYKALSADGRKAHGLSPSFIVYDELAQARNRDLFDNLTTGTGARAEPLTIVISTQSPDPHHVMSELVDFGQSILDGTIEDETFLPVIYAAPDEADPWDDSVWRSCNPALGDFRSLEEFKNFAEQAQKIPTREATFRNLYLNQRVDAEAGMFNTSDIEACALDPFPDLAGRACYAGLDLSSSQDLTALVLCFPPLAEDDPYLVLPFAWVPAQAVKERSRVDRVPYDVWKREGYIEAMAGSVINYKAILKKIDDLAKIYDIKAVIYDRWGATKIISDLEGAEMRVITMGQGFASMSPPTKELERLILERGIAWPANPCLSWNLLNCVASIDPAGNVKMDKSRAREKIDLAVALVMALDGALRNTQRQTEPTISWI